MEKLVEDLLRDHHHIVDLCLAVLRTAAFNTTQAAASPAPVALIAP